MRRLFKKEKGHHVSSRPDQILAIQSTNPQKWSAEDVACYLDIIDLGEYRQTFLKNDISGKDLLELTNEELVNLGLNRIGHRKQLLRKVAQLQAAGIEEARPTSVSEDESGSDTGGSTSSHGSSFSSSSKSKSETERPHKVKVYFEDQTKLFALATITYEALIKEVKKRVGVRHPRLAYLDRDGDAVDVASQDDLTEVLADLGADQLKLKVTSDHRNHVTAAEQSLLNALPQPIIVWTRSGRVIARNTAASALELSSRRVSHLFPTYPGGTGTWNVNIPAGAFELSVTRTKTNSRHTYTGTLHETASVEHDWAATYSRLDDAVVVINAKGIIEYANNALKVVFGYDPSEAIGENVGMLMPPEDAVKHDGYIRNYLRSGVAKVVGSGRVVVGQGKDGALVPIYLTLIEQGHGPSAKFIGLIRLQDSSVVAQKTLLQSERETIDALSAAAVVIDSSAKIVGLNRKMERLCGYKYIELLSRNISILMAPAIARLHDGYISRYLASREAHIIGVGRQIQLLQKDGQLVDVSIFVTEKTDGELTLFTGVFSKVELD